jgi:hypothetical protein
MKNMIRINKKLSKYYSPVDFPFQAYANALIEFHSEFNRAFSEQNILMTLFLKLQYPAFSDDADFYFKI